MVKPPRWVTALVLLAGLVCAAGVGAQEALQFNVPYHCPDGTDNIITRCQSNARGEVCFWREEKNGQLIVERYNIRSQMDGWLRICKVQNRPRPDAAPGVRAGQALSPGYLSGMPPVELVKREIQGNDPTDTLARQVAVFNRLPEIIQRFQLADRSRYDPTPDEQKITGQYQLAAYELEQGYKKTHSAAEAQEFARLHGRYEVDANIRHEMFAKLFSPAFLEEYRKIDRSVNEWYQAHLEQEKRAGEEQRAQASSAQGGSPFVRNDPGTLAARRCVELGGSELECVGKGFTTGLLGLVGVEPGVIGAVKPDHPGMIIAGQYAGANGMLLRFAGGTASLIGCGKLVESVHRYTITKRGTSLALQFASEPKAFTAVLGPDGNISGPGLTEVKGQVIVGYHHYTEYKRRVSDNSIVPGSERPVSEPIYGDRVERCEIGALRSTGPVVSGDLLPALLDVAGGGNGNKDAKYSPAGPRMSGLYESAGGLKIQFASEGAVLDCGEAHVARSYTLENTLTAVRITINNGGVALPLTLQADGALAGPATAEVTGRVVTGTTTNGIAFAPRTARCGAAVLNLQR